MHCLCTLSLKILLVMSEFPRTSSPKYEVRNRRKCPTGKINFIKAQEGHSVTRVGSSEDPVVTNTPSKGKELSATSNHHQRSPSSGLFHPIYKVLSCHLILNRYHTNNNPHTHHAKHMNKASQQSPQMKQLTQKCSKNFC